MICTPPSISWPSWETAVTDGFNTCKLHSILARVFSNAVRCLSFNSWSSSEHSLSLPSLPFPAIFQSSPHSSLPSALGGSTSVHFTSQYRKQWWQQSNLVINYKYWNYFQSSSYYLVVKLLFIVANTLLNFVTTFNKKWLTLFSNLLWSLLC